MIIDSIPVDESTRKKVEKTARTRPGFWPARGVRGPSLRRKRAPIEAPIGVEIICDFCTEAGNWGDSAKRSGFATAVASRAGRIPTRPHPFLFSIQDERDAEPHYPTRKPATLPRC